ncbi:glycosyl transferase, partial [Streptomyces sp. NPDC059456]
ATLALLRDDERRAELGRRSRERVVEKFTLHQSVDGFRHIYRELAGQPVLPVHAGDDWTQRLADPWYRELAADGSLW